MIYLASAFSINMLDDSAFPAVIEMEEVDISVAAKMAEMLDTSDTIKNIIGHPDTARLVGKMLDHPLAANRVSVKAVWGDIFIVAQHQAPTRLRAGTTKLPEGADIKFYKVFVGADS